MIRTIAASALIGVALGVVVLGAEQAQPAARRYAVRPLAWGYQSVVIDGCIIEGRAYPPGTPSPANECRICQPETNLFAWSAAPAETACEGGGQCGSAGMGCVGAEDPGLTEEFLGAPWEVTNVDTIRCSDGSSETTPPGYSRLTFTSAHPDRMQTWSTLGCVFTFNVRVATATLSNGPVACMDRAREITVTAYTVTVSEGRSLTLSSESSETFSDGVTCTVISNGTATR